MRILSGTEAAEPILRRIKEKVAELDPKLVIIQVGDNAVSTTYIERKLKAAESVNMRCEHMKLPTECTLQELLSILRTLNADDDVTGYIIQLPLPTQLREHLTDILSAIDPHKDVDGFCPENLGRLQYAVADAPFTPATPTGVIRLLKHYNIPLAGMHCVVVGRSNIVGKPLALMLLENDATVTICHSATDNLASFTVHADILFVAVGKPGLITANMVKPGAIVIDVGITKVGKSLKGDVLFDDVQHRASAITPVPGGVGPMTVATLLENCVRAKEAAVKRAAK